MIVQRFLQWCDIKTATQRAEGVAKLATAFICERIADADRLEVEAVLTLATEDPSPKVRLALAAALAASAKAPRAVIAALALDIEPVAAPVIAGSPLLSESELRQIARSGNEALQLALAARRDLSDALVDILSARGTQAVCLQLLAHDDAEFGAAALSTLVERWSGDACVRSALTARRDLSAAARNRLMSAAAADLGASPFLRNVLGAERSQRVVGEARERGTLRIAAEAGPDLGSLIEELRTSGQLTTAFLIRAICAGDVDLFAAALVALSGKSYRRVRAIVVEGRSGAFVALTEAAGLPASSAALLRRAVQLWKQAAAVQTSDAPGVAADVLRQLLAETNGAEGVSDEAADLLQRLASEASNEDARHRAWGLAAAA
ncbi:DUF2336 domain-containing protein [Mangrovibrevibacter kandeliae]|uniref:DUF2336 domain-containing protein n=1 Tax=Mangrovibrevibacter kandeliae TaxID=2968473 RepID=UPI0021183F02|nr:DUF2336 domain-containing protein [Aurantimonas sp. CSK15Z-1]MCQ8782690.1 DUF2336 domain-containing protein [Aurantimonas sp. CSK15Z-1]